MHASFRASKVILSKVGTAASFGFGLHAGARYADSQSGHRIAIEEARALSLPHMDMRDIEETDLDVDRNDLLFGYSCFRGRDTATVATQLSESLELNAKKVANEIRQRCAVAGAMHITGSDGHLDEHSGVRSESSGVDEMHSISRNLATQENHMHSQSETRIRRYSAPPLLPKTGVKLKCQNIEDKEDKEDIINARALTVVEDDEKETIEKKYPPSRPYHYCQHHFGTENLTWNSLVENDYCSICSDLLAVPVVAPCNHEYCGHCFNRLVKSEYGIYPVSCSLCRKAIQRDEALLDVQRDGFIAERVALFVEQQKSRSTDGNWEGKSDYDNWLKRREQYFMSRYTRVELEEDNIETQSLDFDEEAELDDFPIEELTDNVGSENVISDMNDAVMMAMGVVMGAICCFLLVPSVRQSHGQNSLLKEMAVALWR